MILSHVTFLDVIRLETKHGRAHETHPHEQKTVGDHPMRCTHFVLARSLSLSHFPETFQTQQRIFPQFEIASLVSISYCCPLWHLRCPPGPTWTTFGTSWAPLPPPDISKQLPWRSWGPPKVPFGLSLSPRPKRTALRLLRRTHFTL